MLLGDVALGYSTVYSHAYACPHGEYAASPAVRNEPRSAHPGNNLLMF
jgi:hypothetical protein